MSIGPRYASKVIFVYIHSLLAFGRNQVGRLGDGDVQASLLGRVAVGERCVLAAWELAQDGRKHFTATALYGEDGSCRALARGTWFEVP